MNRYPHLTVILGLSAALAGPLQAATPSAPPAGTPPAPPVAACPKVVLGAGPDYPPLHWYDGTTLRGASIDITRRIFADMGVPVEVRYVGPFARLMANAKQGQIDVVATLKQTPERAAFLTFTTVPAFANPVSVFVARSRSFPYKGWSDLEGRIGGVAIGTRFGEPFDSYLAQKLHIENSSSLESNFKKLGVGRINYLITGYYNGTAYIEAHGLQQQFIALQPSINETQNHVAFYSQSPCMRYYKEFDRRLGLLVKSGETGRLIQAALQQWRENPHTVR